MVAPFYGARPGVLASHEEPWYGPLCVAQVVLALGLLPKVTGNTYVPGCSGPVPRCRHHPNVHSVDLSPSDRIRATLMTAGGWCYVVGV